MLSEFLEPILQILGISMPCLFLLILIIVTFLRG